MQMPSAVVFAQHFAAANTWWYVCESSMSQERRSFNICFEYHITSDSLSRLMVFTTMEKPSTLSLDHFRMPRTRNRKNHTKHTLFKLLTHSTVQLILRSHLTKYWNKRLEFINFCSIVLIAFKPETYLNQITFSHLTCSSVISLCQAQGIFLKKKKTTKRGKKAKRSNL